MNKEKVDIRYLAGLFEGEGSAFISKSDRQGEIKYNCAVVIQMVDYEPVQAFQEYFGIGSVHKIFRGENYQRSKDTYKYEVSGKRAAIIAKQLVKYVLTPRKKQALQCIIEFSKTIKHFGGRWHPLTEDESYLRGQLCKTCSSLNARGRGANNQAFYSIPAIEYSSSDQLSFWDSLDERTVKSEFIDL